LAPREAVERRDPRLRRARNQSRWRAVARVRMKDAAAWRDEKSRLSPLLIGDLAQQRRRPAFPRFGFEHTLELEALSRVRKLEHLLIQKLCSAVQSRAFRLSAVEHDAQRVPAKFRETTATDAGNEAQFLS